MAVAVTVVWGAAVEVVAGARQVPTLRTVWIMTNAVLIPGHPVVQVIPTAVMNSTMLQMTGHGVYGAVVAVNLRELIQAPYFGSILALALADGHFAIPERVSG